MPFHELSAHNCIDTTSLKKFLQIYERYKNKILSQERLKKTRNYMEWRWQIILEDDEGKVINYLKRLVLVIL